MAWAWELLTAASLPPSSHLPSLLQSRPPVMAIAQSSDRKSTRLNSSHSQISYAVFCLKKKKKTRGVVRDGRYYGYAKGRYVGRLYHYTQAGSPSAVVHTAALIKTAHSVSHLRVCSSLD